MAIPELKNEPPRAQQCHQELSRTDAGVTVGTRTPRSENPSFHWFCTVILEHPPVGSARWDLPSRLAPAAPRRQRDLNRPPRRHDPGCWSETSRAATQGRGARGGSWTLESCQNHFYSLCDRITFFLVYGNAAPGSQSCLCAHQVKAFCRRIGNPTRQTPKRGGG